LLDITISKIKAGEGSKAHHYGGGLAASTILDSPRKVMFDTSGNMYIADAGNHRILMVTKITGITTTVAGDGTAGYSGDGGLATLARLNFPSALAFAASGNVYIADTYNHRIRKVTKSTGIISTYAGTGTAGYSGDGGLPTLAKLDTPHRISFDVFGNLYIAGNDGEYFRAVTADGANIIFLAAGNGTSVSRGDSRLENLRYLYSTNDQRVRFLYLTNGINLITAGTGTAGYSGDEGLAVSAQLNNLAGLSLGSG
jgi:trimeric autotransporter adhesin